jgi:hypothetical protein
MISVVRDHCPGGTTIGSWELAVAARDRRVQQGPRLGRVTALRAADDRVGGVLMEAGGRADLDRVESGGLECAAEFGFGERASDSAGAGGHIGAGLRVKVGVGNDD